jgi:hypothetical protein
LSTYLPKSTSFVPAGTDLGVKLLTHEKYAQNQPIIPVSRELNEPIVEWTDNKTLLTGAFPDNFFWSRCSYQIANSTKLETFFSLL